MTVDLSKVDEANRQVQGSTVSKVQKAYDQAVRDALHAAFDPSPPPSSQLWGSSNNVGYDVPGIPARLKYLTDLGAKVTREDTANAIGQLTAAGIKTVQIIPLGAAGSADPRAWVYQLGGNEWWFVNNPTGLDPAAYFKQVSVDAQAIQQKYPHALISVPLITYGWTSPLAGGWAACDDRGNYQWNGQLRPAVQWLHDAAPELLTLASSWEVHPYGTRGVANMDLVRSQLASYGAAQPFLVGEDGWSTYGNSEQAQADFFTGRIAAMKARTDLLAWIQYRVQDLQGQSPPSENGYGVRRINSDWSDAGPKLAYAIVQKACA